MNFAVSGVIRALGYRGYPARREHVGTPGPPSGSLAASLRCLHAVVRDERAKRRKVTKDQ